MLFRDCTFFFSWSWISRFSFLFSSESTWSTPVPELQSLKAEHGANLHYWLQQDPWEPFSRLQLTWAEAAAWDCPGPGRPLPWVVRSGQIRRRGCNGKGTGAGGLRIVMRNLGRQNALKLPVWLLVVPDKTPSVRTCGLKPSTLKQLGQPIQQPSNSGEVKVRRIPFPEEELLLQGQGLLLVSWRPVQKAGPHSYTVDLWEAV